MLIQNAHIAIEEVAWAVEIEIEAELHQNLILQVFDILPSERALGLTNQLIVCIDHVLIVWKLRLFELGGNQKT